MEHDPLVKVAFCPILFGANGGQFTALGLPIFDPREYAEEEEDMGPGGEDGSTPRGNCDEPWDCGVCIYMRQWIEGMSIQGWSVGWECLECVTTSWKYERRNAEVERMLPGFFQSGRRPDRSSEDPKYDRDRPPLTGCTSCGVESSFLQLILRRARRR